VKWDVVNLIAQVRSVCEITPDGCWLWRHGSWADRDPDACKEYPRLMIGGERHHVATWVLKVAAGSAPGKEPCHSCDRPACVAPDHLRWGTHQENMAEMGARHRSGAQQYPERYATGRWQRTGGPRGDDHPMHRNPMLAARGERHGSKTHPERWYYGEDIPSAKLTAAQIPGIRSRLEAGDKPVAIAADLGVGRGTIRAIAEGRTWRRAV
jgi:hypothetical protein